MDSQLVAAILCVIAPIDGAVMFVLASRHDDPKVANVMRLSGVGSAFILFGLGVAIYLGLIPVRG